MCTYTLKIYHTDTATRVESYLYEDDVCINTSSFHMGNTIHRPGKTLSSALVDYATARAGALIRQNGTHHVLASIQINPEN